MEIKEKEKEDGMERSGYRKRLGHGAIFSEPQKIVESFQVNGLSLTGPNYNCLDPDLI